MIVSSVAHAGAERRQERRRGQDAAAPRGGLGRRTGLVWTGGILLEYRKFAGELSGEMRIGFADGRRVTMGTYTKNDLVVELAAQAGISRRKTLQILDKLAEVAYREARQGGFTVPGLCRIDVIRRNARRARNPRTGETLLIAEHDMVRVRHLKKVRDMVTPPPPGLVTVLPPEPTPVAPPLPQPLMGAPAATPWAS